MGRSFGFEKGGEILIPEEADAIRLAARLILDGASLREVGRVVSQHFAQERDETRRLIDSQLKAAS